MARNRKYVVHQHGNLTGSELRAGRPQPPVVLRAPRSCAHGAVTSESRAMRNDRSRINRNGGDGISCADHGQKNVRCALPRCTPAVPFSFRGVSQSCCCASK